MEIHHTSSFRKSLRKLSQDMNDRFTEREDMFRADPFHASLKTHMLRGAMKGLYSFSLDRRYRVVFVFKTKDQVIFIDIGTHDIYE